MIKGVTIIDIVTSIDGVLSREANSVVKLLATKIALGWVRVTLAFAILRATNLVHKRNQSEMEKCSAYG